MRRIISYLLLPLFLLSCVVACSGTLEEYPIPTPKDGRSYSLSADTVELDTLPSLILSSTYSLRLFNPANIPLRLPHIYLKSGGKRGFQLNINGKSTTESKNVLLEPRDSIFLFVRAYLPEGVEDKPELIQDSIMIEEQNGRQTHIPIRATRQNVQHLDELIVKNSMELSEPRPIVIRDSIYVAQGVRLTMMPNTRILLGDKAHIRVDGELVLRGTLHEPVRLTNIRQDRFLPRVPYSRVPGQWGGILVGKNGRLTAEWLQLTNSKWGIYFEDSDTQSSTTEYRGELRYSRLHNISGIGLRAETGRYLIEDSELSNTEGTTLSLSGGDYQVRRTSIINLYPWPHIHNQYALTYTNSKAPSGTNMDMGIAEPMSQLTIEYSVIDGSRGKAAGGEILIRLAANTSARTIVSLRHSYLRGQVYNKPELIREENIIYPTEGKPEALYRRVGLDSLRRRDYLFDFRPLSSAPFANKLDNTSGTAPNDLAGRPRGRAASYGAYEPALD